jgi:hypothetical protein
VSPDCSPLLRALVIKAGYSFQPAWHRSARMLMARRLVMALLIWTLLTGSSTFTCTSGDGGLPGFNRAPVAQDDDYSVPAGTVLVGTARASDPDGDTLSYSILAGPTLGELLQFDGANGAFRYLSQIAGADSFSFQASDGSRDSNTGRVRITVTAAPGGIQALAATSAGPVALAGGRLLRLEDPAAVPLLTSISSLNAAGSDWELRLEDGSVACLQAFGGLRHGQACPADRSGGPVPASEGLDRLALAHDPWDQARVLEVAAGPSGVLLTESLAAGRQARPIVRIVGPADRAELQFGLSEPGRAWLSLTNDNRTRIMTSEDGGRSWRIVAELPGTVTALAGTATGPAGVFVLRAGPETPALVVVTDVREH